MTARANFSTYQKERRARLRREGICVDCGKNEIKADPITKKTHVVCDDCRKARRDRLAANKRQYSLVLTAATEATL
jgi:hypothetical protein